jgi:hypothetical protein
MTIQMRISLYLYYYDIDIRYDVVQIVFQSKPIALMLIQTF